MLVPGVVQRPIPAPDRIPAPGGGSSAPPYPCKKVKIEKNSKVVADVWGTDFIKIFSALVVLHLDDLKNRMNCTGLI